MQNLLVAMMRFSAAVTLYGMEQVQKTMDVVDGGEDMSKAMERLETTLNSLTDTLVGKIDTSKQDTLKSVTKMSEDVIGRTMDGVSMMDPREVMKATNDLIQKTSVATADLVGKAASVVETSTDNAKTQEQAA
jgi:hypothetical protein